MWHWAQNLDSRCPECVEDSQTNVSHHSPPGYPWPTAQSTPLYSHVNSTLLPPLSLFLRASAKSDKPQMGVVVCRHTCSGLLPELPFEMTTIYIRWRADKEWERKYKCLQFNSSVYKGWRGGRLGLSGGRLNKWKWAAQHLLQRQIFAQGAPFNLCLYWFYHMLPWNLCGLKQP